MNFIRKIKMKLENYFIIRTANYLIIRRENLKYFEKNKDFLYYLENFKITIKIEDYIIFLKDKIKKKRSYLLFKTAIKILQEDNFAE